MVKKYTSYRSAHSLAIMLMATSIVLGISADSSSAMLEQLNIRQKSAINTPLTRIEQLSMRVVHTCDMIHTVAEDRVSQQATFVIDDRTILMPNDASMAKLVRIVAALQTPDANKPITAKDWQPGDSMIIPPLATAESRMRMIEGYQCIDWYISKAALVSF